MPVKRIFATVYLLPYHIAYPENRCSLTASSAIKTVASHASGVEGVPIKSHKDGCKRRFRSCIHNRSHL